MSVLNLTVKKFFTYVTICGLLLQPTVACAAINRMPSSSTEYKVATATKAEKIKINPTKPTQATSPTLILNTEDIFYQGLIRPPPIDGPRTGGGGNSCSLGITQNTKKLLYLLNQTAFAHVVDLEKLFPTIKNSRFMKQDKLMIDGAAKDAMNYPETKTIFVTPHFCKKELTIVSGRSMSLLLHEYLGLARIDDENYQVSGKFLEIYTSTAAWSAPLISNIDVWDERWKGEPEMTIQISGEAAEKIMKGLKQEPHFHRGLLMNESADYKISCEKRFDEDGTSCTLTLQR